MPHSPDIYLKPDRKIWTEADLPYLGWHNCVIHDFTLERTDQPSAPNFLLDLDYILQWLKPNELGYFQFWTAPTTLIFYNVQSLRIEIDPLWKPPVLLEIDEIYLKRESPKSSKEIRYQGEISLRRGRMSFNAQGFKQIVRKPPKLSTMQHWGLEERGGVSFDKTPYKLEDETLLTLP